jgi:glycosyltransferase involved in cell wall biosynthesis
VKIALLTEIPAPFRIPLFNALAARPDVDLRVLFLAEEDPRRRHYRVYEGEFRFASRVLPGWHLRRGGRWVVINGQTVRELRRFRPDVVIVGGWNQPALWGALAFARIRHVPAVCWVESTLRDERPRSRPLQLVKLLFVRSCAAFLVPGRASAAYVRSLGVPDELIAVAPNAVDTEIFARARVDRSGREGCTFLYVGRLDPEKGLDVLLRAFEEVPGRLVLAGSGTEEERLRAAAGERIEFLGPRDRDELPALYAEADVFVLPSLSEPWGMVLLEAAAAGLPLVATDAAGAAWEVVENDRNGYRVPAGDVGALAEALRLLAVDPARRARLGDRSAEIARRFSPEAWASGLANAVRRVTAT